MLLVMFSLMSTSRQRKLDNERRSASQSIKSLNYLYPKMENAVSIYETAPRRFLALFRTTNPYDLLLYVV